MGLLLCKKKLILTFQNAKDIYEKLEVHQYKIFKRVLRKINKGKLKIVKNKYCLPTIKKGIFR